MVYKQGNQLTRYHLRPEQHLSTRAHFYDGLELESPDPDRLGPGQQHKHSTYAVLYNGSRHHLREAAAKTSKPPAGARCSLTVGKDALFPEPPHHTRTLPSQTYRGNGTFTVEYPHSSLTYRSLKLVPYGQLSWKTEYSDKYTGKKLNASMRGYSILSTRR